MKKTLRKTFKTLKEMLKLEPQRVWGEKNQISLEMKTLKELIEEGEPTKDPRIFRNRIGTYDAVCPDGRGLHAHRFDVILKQLNKEYDNSRIKK